MMAAVEAWVGAHGGQRYDYGGSLFGMPVIDVPKPSRIDINVPKPSRGDIGTPQALERSAAAFLR